MLNLLKFKEFADFDGLQEISIKRQHTGREAYEIYMQKTIPFLREAGSKILFSGSSKAFTIGPKSEKWDYVLLVKHESVEKFIAFAENKEYLKVSGYRKAALEDSRLLPISEEISQFDL